MGSSMLRTMLNLCGADHVSINLLKFILHEPVHVPNNKCHLIYIQEKLPYRRILHTNHSEGP